MDHSTASGAATATQLALGSTRRLVLCAKLRGSMVAGAAARGSSKSTRRNCCAARTIRDGGGGRSIRAKSPLGAVEVADGGAAAHPSREVDYSADSCIFIAVTCAGVPQNRRMVAIRRSGVSHDPMSSARWRHIVLPWVHRVFSNLKIWALGVYHGCAAGICNPIDESLFQRRHSTAFARCSASRGHALAKNVDRD